MKATKLITTLLLLSFFACKKDQPQPNNNQNNNEEEEHVFMPNKDVVSITINGEESACDDYSFVVNGNGFSMFSFDADATSLVSNTMLYNFEDKSGALIDFTYITVDNQIWLNTAMSPTTLLKDKSLYVAEEYSFLIDTIARTINLEYKGQFVKQKTTSNALDTILHIVVEANGLNINLITPGEAFTE